MKLYTAVGIFLIYNSFMDEADNFSPLKLDNQDEDVSPPTRRFRPLSIIIGFFLALVLVVFAGYKIYFSPSKSIKEKQVKEISSVTLTTFPLSKSKDLESTAKTATATPTVEPTKKVIILPSKLTGFAFEDKNGNKIRESDEKGLTAVLSLYKFTGVNQTVLVTGIFSNEDGSFSYDLTEPAKYMLTGGQKTFYTPPFDAYIFTTLGDGAAFTYNAPYKPEVSTSGGFKIFVYNDKNESLRRDDDEELIHYQYAKIRNKGTGETWNLAIPPEGATETNLTSGSYSIRLEPENESWDYYYKRLQSLADVDINTTSDMKEIYLGVRKLE